MAEGRFTNPVTASLVGVKDFFSKQQLASRFTDEDRADGKTVLVTGASSGLGFALAVEFARRGGKVIMACRSKINIIHQFVQSLVEDHIELDICILNAAVALSCVHAGRIPDRMRCTWSTTCPKGSPITVILSWF
jgi:hypothetical protein